MLREKIILFSFIFLWSLFTTQVVNDEGDYDYEDKHEFDEINERKIMMTKSNILRIMGKNNECEICRSKFDMSQR